MTDTITPALSAEEWGDVGTERNLDSLLSHYGDGVDALGGFQPQRSAVDNTHVLIALANHALPDTDPRKITRVDVELLQSIDLRLLSGGRIPALAAKLSALLPPE